MLPPVTETTPPEPVCTFELWDKVAATTPLPLLGSVSKEPFPGIKMQIEFEATGYELSRMPIFFRWFRVRGRRVFPRAWPSLVGIADLLLHRQSLRTITDVNLLDTSIAFDPPSK